MSSDADQHSLLAQALEEFLAAESVEEMAAVVEEYPVITTSQFEASVARLVEHAARSGDPEAVLHLQEQTALLEQVWPSETASPAEEAVAQFLQAENEEEARAVFARHPDLLRSEEAAQILAAIEAEDPESHLYLETRRSLWRALAGRTGTAPPA